MHLQVQKVWGEAHDGPAWPGDEPEEEGSSSTKARTKPKETEGGIPAVPTTTPGSSGPAPASVPPAPSSGTPPAAWRLPNRTASRPQHLSPSPAVRGRRGLLPCRIHGGDPEGRPVKGERPRPTEMAEEEEEGGKENQGGKGEEGEAWPIGPIL